MVKRIQVVCVLSGFILYAVLELVSHNQSQLGSGELKRASHGEGEVLYEVFVKGLELDNPGQETEILIPVKERAYSLQEAEALYDRVLPELVAQILGDNESLSSVRSDLRLVRSLEPYGLKIQWESENPELLDSFGTVYNQNMETAEDTYLRARVSDGQFNREYDIRVTVLPPAFTETERAVNEFKRKLAQMDERQSITDQLTLPPDYEGRKLSYRMEAETDYRILPVLGILLAVLYHVRDKMNVQEKEKRRKEMLLMDYPEVVSKLMVFIGAGMTVRIAWERIADGYAQAAGKNGKSVRPAYEEMSRTVSQLRSGTPESRAYGEFGRRCGLRPYLKLGALLEQNRKTGTKNLKSALEYEMTAAFEERKNLAKRLGEEAGTKLLVPLFLMLGIIMVMIVVPAFLSFY